MGRSLRALAQFSRARSAGLIFSRKPLQAPRVWPDVARLPSLCAWQGSNRPAIRRFPRPRSAPGVPPSGCVWPDSGRSTHSPDAVERSTHPSGASISRLASALISSQCWRTSCVLVRRWPASVRVELADAGVALLFQTMYRRPPRGGTVLPPAVAAVALRRPSSSLVRSRRSREAQTTLNEMTARDGR